MLIQTPTNDEIADLLNHMADLLEDQDDNPYRVQAFRSGAKNVRATATPLTQLVEQDGPEAQCTVVTETNGPLRGQRVVRGRERECRAFYQDQS